MSDFHYINGYVLVYKPDHKSAFKKESSGHKGYVYEHILVAERNIGRSLRATEVVHHLDFIRSNNNPSNLLVMENSEHNRLHRWINQGAELLGKQRLYQTLDELDNYCGKPHKQHKILKIRRCEICSFPLRNSQEHTCSEKCHKERIQRECGIHESQLTRKKLKSLLRQHSWVAVGRMYGVSDNCIRKWAVKLGIDPKNYARGFER